MTGAVFVDTSAIFALLDASDPAHARARAALDALEKDETALLTTSFVVVETIALLQNRIGIEAVRAMQSNVAPALDITWITPALYARGLEALLAARNRRVSLTDWTSFLVMRDLGLRRAFAFDGDFARQGFELVPGPEPG